LYNQTQYVSQSIAVAGTQQGHALSLLMLYRETRFSLAQTVCV